MGLGDMEMDLEKMLNSMKEELEEEPLKQEKTKDREMDLDDLLNGLSNMMIREKKKAAEIRSWEEGKKTAGNMGNVAANTANTLTGRVPGGQNAGKTRPHILIVDDDIRLLKMMKEILKNDYDTAVATNGEIALQFLERHTTDMILLDYMMPGQNGKEVLEQIRKNPRYKDVPVIFLTGVSDAKKVKECLALHPRGYMLKPIKQSELLKRMKEILG